MQERNPSLANLICPNCNKSTDAATGVTDEKATPSDGDLSICAYCCTGLIFRKVDSGLMTLQKASEEDCKELSNIMRGQGYNLPVSLLLRGWDYD